MPKYKTSLARGAAIFLVGSLAAGCSVANLTDGLTTNSTAPVGMAQANQPYPGENRIVRPKADIGGGGILQPSSEVSSLPAPAATPAYGVPVYTAPRSSSVSSAPLPPPGAAQSSASPVTAVPVEQPRQVAAAPQAPQPSRTRASEPSAGGSYRVDSGDTLYGIARKTGVSVSQLKEANGLSDGAIRIGQNLVIPGSGAAVSASAPAQQPQPVRTVSAPSAKPAQPAAPKPAAVAAAPQPEPAVVAAAPKPEAQDEPRVTAYTPPTESKTKAIEAVEQTQVAALPPESTGVGRLRWPAQGRVIAGFGSSGGKKSDGIDIAVPEGTAVHAAENGVVIYAGDGLKGFGNTVLVRHEDGLVTVYGHASELKVKRGDQVRRGQEIARSGMTGDADRPKLHFEVRKGTSPVDPMTYLR
uniref:Peptidase M23B n=2 Tax=Phyllobacteriaceae TaxID=69277 RepID=Q11HD1_CHESB